MTAGDTCLLVVLRPCRDIRRSAEMSDIALLWVLYAYWVSNTDDLDRLASDKGRHFTGQCDRPGLGW
jgi:hypothetical protein